MRGRRVLFFGCRMTTIAYDRATRTMAADTQCSAGARKFRTHKVRRLKDGGLVGSCGSLSDILKVHRWAESGFSAKDRPDFGDNEAEFESLVVRGDGATFILDENLELMQFEDDFLAIGSGGTYATAAMACGKSVVEAVELAARFDPGTGGPVDVFHVESPRAPRKRK